VAYRQRVHPGRTPAFPIPIRLPPLLMLFISVIVARTQVEYHLSQLCLKQRADSYLRPFLFFDVGRLGLFGSGGGMVRIPIFRVLSFDGQPTRDCPPFHFPESPSLVGFKLKRYTPFPGGICPFQDRVTLHLILFFFSRRTRLPL